MDTLTGCILTSPANENNEESQEFHPEAILAERVNDKGEKQYLIKVHSAPC
jgi:hypothetical protein